MSLNPNKKGILVCHSCGSHDMSPVAKITGICYNCTNDMFYKPEKKDEPPLEYGFLGYDPSETENR